MRYLARWSFRALVALSLLLCVGFAAWWPRTHRQMDLFCRISETGSTYVLLTTPNYLSVGRHDGLGFMTYILDDSQPPPRWAHIPVPYGIEQTLRLRKNRGFNSGHNGIGIGEIKITYTLSKPDPIDGFFGFGEDLLQGSQIQVHSLQFINVDSNFADAVGSASVQPAASAQPDQVVWSLNIPFWVLIAATAILPCFTGVRLAARWRRTRRRRKLGLCIACGYDLRASTDRCPECGMRIISCAPS